MRLFRIWRTYQVPRGAEDSEESPEVKRLCDDLFLDMLDDDVDTGDRDPSAGFGLRDEEFRGGNRVAGASAWQWRKRTRILGFLLGASDDELGLPPAPVSSEEDGEDVDVVTGGLEVEGGGYGDQIWVFDDEIFDGGLGFGMRMEERDVAGSVP
ncbi:uncharacterized protein LOC120270320 [Dioscorea cayenensis subsp. rotundata]|uniref:Uncharacterized protein LOC120270320 n=1 Tax=Dioscorea cayennensis subsp. rotundata TaxID=55577 RepID=A0AB40C2L8_DIOCR|nr:uncharacterized protein LOC120270320 [Dioscorea cayenensis subsp. rotundata]